MIKLDDRDLKMLSILQTEGRITKTELAKRVNLSPTPCWDRLKRLEDAGIIEGYGARISAGALGSLSIIFAEVELGTHQAEDFSHFEAAIIAIPEIVECWAVGGGIDYILKFACKNIDAYQQLIDQMLSDKLGISRYQTLIVTKPVKQSAMPPILQNPQTQR